VGRPARQPARAELLRRSDLSVAAGQPSQRAVSERGAGRHRRAEEIYAQAGATLRLGQGLQDDFGAGKIMPGTSGGDAYNPDSGFAWYAFTGVDGQAVAYNTLLAGNSFSSSGPSVDTKHIVGEFNVGLAVIWHGVRITATQTWQSHEFTSQEGGWFDYGSVAVSARF
jgi:lipid A 3-O-deacylase